MVRVRSLSLITTNLETKYIDVLYEILTLKY